MTETYMNNICMAILGLVGVSGAVKITMLLVKAQMSEDSGDCKQKIKNVALFMIIAELIVSVLRPIVNYYYL